MYFYLCFSSYQENYHKGSEVILLYGCRFFFFSQTTFVLAELYKYFSFVPTYAHAKQLELIEIWEKCHVDEYAFYCCSFKNVVEEFALKRKKNYVQLCFFCAFFSASNYTKGTIVVENAFQDIMFIYLYMHCENYCT